MDHASPWDDAKLHATEATKLGCFKEILSWLFTIVLAILLIVQPSIDLSSMKLISC